MVEQWLSDTRHVCYYRRMTEQPIVPGWSWDHDVRLCEYAAKEVKGETVEEWIPVLPFNVVPARALREGEDIKVVEAEIVYVSGRTRQVVLSAELISRARPADLLRDETGIDLSHKEATALSRFLEVIVHDGSTVPVDDVLTAAAWQDDELHVPGAVEVSPRPRYAELAKYGDVRGDERSAKRAWSDVLQLAARHPKLLLALGMPIGSIYAARLRHAPYNKDTATFALHLTGESAQGKTQAAISAMMTVGDATEKATSANLYRTWDMSAQAPIALAHQLGVLPLFFDEAASSQKTPEEFTQMLFALAQGTERQRATVTGDLDEVDRWECCVLSTGEMRLTGKSGLVGVRRRVQELYTPMADQYTSDRVLELTSAYHGWPLRWIAAEPDVAVAAALLEQVVSTFEDGPSWLNAAAVNLAVCGLGAVMMARSLDVEDVTPPVVHDAVAEVVRRAGRAAVEEGLDAGIRLLKAVWAAAAMRPNSFPSEDDAIPIGREREGVMFRDGTIGVLDAVGLRRIAKDVGLLDYQAGLRLLREHDFMVTERGRDQAMRVLKMPDGDSIRKRIYVFKSLDERDR